MAEPFLADGEGYLRDPGPEALGTFVAYAQEADLDAAVAIRSWAERTDNASLVAQIGAHNATGQKPRLLGAVTANPLLPDTMADVERAAGEWRDAFASLKLMAAAHLYEIDAPFVDPFMAAARRAGWVVTIHSGGPYAAATRIVRLAERFPDVPIVMDHMGFPDAVDDAIAGAARLPHLYLLTTILRFFKGQEETVAPAEVRRAVEIAGPHKVVFGSNQPEYRPVQVQAAIRRLGLGSETESLIFGENFKRIYRL